ncbi:hypothetical protein SAFG77S_04714 [Streptomyces afghaniensis]
MQTSEVRRAVETGGLVSTASSLGLTADDAIVLHDSNKLTLRLLPCDVLARVAPVAQQVAQFEVELAQRLAASGCPVAALEPRSGAAQVHERDGFAVTLWTYYEPVTPREVSPADYATALDLLHAGMRTVDVPTPHFTDRVEQAQRLVGDRAERTPALADADRELLGDTLRSLRRVIVERGGAEQLLHGSRRATCSPRRTDCCSSTWRRVAVGPSNSTSPMRPMKSASTIRVSIRTCCARAGSSCWR